MLADLIRLSCCRMCGGRGAHAVPPLAPQPAGALFCAKGAGVF